jgi:hypothetical protein
MKFVEIANTVINVEEIVSMVENPSYDGLNSVTINFKHGVNSIRIDNIDMFDVKAELLESHGIRI